MRKNLPRPYPIMLALPSTSTTTAGYVTRAFGIPMAIRRGLNSFSRVLEIDVWCLRQHFWQRNLLSHSSARYLPPVQLKHSLFSESILRLSPISVIFVQLTDRWFWSSQWIHCWFPVRVSCCEWVLGTRVGFVCFRFEFPLTEIFSAMFSATWLMSVHFLSSLKRSLKSQFLQPSFPHTRSAFTPFNLSKVERKFPLTFTSRSSVSKLCTL